MKTRTITRIPVIHCCPCRVYATIFIRKGTRHAVKKGQALFQLGSESHSASQRLVPRTRSQPSDPPLPTVAIRTLPDRWSRSPPRRPCPHSARTLDISAPPLPEPIASYSELYHHATPLIEQGGGKGGERGKRRGSAVAALAGGEEGTRAARLQSFFTSVLSGSSASARTRTRWPRATATPPPPLRRFTITTEVSPWIP